MNDAAPPARPHALPPDSGRLATQLARTTSHTGGAAAVLVVSGDLDSIGAPLLAEVWTAGVDTLPLHVHLDLGRVGFCNAAGVRTVEDILISSRQRGLEVTLTVQPHLDWLLRLVGVDHRRLAQVDVVPRSRGAS